MGDAEFFELLDLDLPQLKRVKAAVAEKDYAAAKHEFAAYLRHRTTKTWTFDPHKIVRDPTHSTGLADNALVGKLWTVSGWYDFPNGEIDWHFNLTETREEMPFNPEWQWQLGRMGYWRALGAAYWSTGDEKYAKAWIEHMRSWIRDCPRIDKLDYSAGACWRQIECGIRMSGSWPEAFHRFLLSPSFSDEDMCLFVKSCAEHGIQLAKYPTRGNWVTHEMNGLYTVGGVFPEFKMAAKWRRQAIDTMYEELDIQFLPDGAQYELTPGYHDIAVGHIASMFDKAHMFGRTEEFPQDFITKLERAYDYNMYLSAPDDQKPKLNDSWGTSSSHNAGRALEYFPHRDDFRWLATGGREGKLPARTSYPFDWAGYYVMRSDWRKDANFLVLDAGPLGAGHDHQDKLNVVLYAYGQEILYDGGGGSYEHSPWRNYAVSTFGHNTILVDGLPQMRSRGILEDKISQKPIEAYWHSDDEFDFALGTYDKSYGEPEYSPVRHTRQVLFIKPDIFIVADVVKSTSGRLHSCQARWHLQTTNTSLDNTGKTVVTTDREQPNLAVVPLLTEGLTVRAVSGQTEPEILGFWVVKNGGRQETTSVLHEREKANTQYLLTLLLPLRSGAANPVVSTRVHGKSEAGVEFSDGRHLMLKFTDAETPSLRVKEILKDDQIGRQWPPFERGMVKVRSSGLPIR